MKIGRNDACPCGSGMKYKKCCGFLGLREAQVKEVPPEIMAEFHRIELEEMYYRRRGIFVNYVRPYTSNSERLWMLGKRLYTGGPKNETFHEFICRVLMNTMGTKWWSENRHSSDPHFLMLCYRKWFEWRQDSQPEDYTVDGTYARIPDGYTSYLLSVAFDICSLIHTDHLPRQLLKRLRDKTAFQAARYEIAIAALFARLGFEVEFLDETSEKSRKHCEFLVTLRETNTVLAVEAKSRHRKGAIHERGSYGVGDELSHDLVGLYKKATNQNPGGIPYLVFIELNYPFTPEMPLEEKPWFAAAQGIVERFFPEPEQPYPVSLIFLTNFSNHFRGNKQMGNAEAMWMMPHRPQFPVPSEIRDKLNLALIHYGFVPNIGASVNPLTGEPLWLSSGSTGRSGLT